jgi:hypothetical protein
MSMNPTRPNVPFDDWRVKGNRRDGYRVEHDRSDVCSIPRFWLESGKIAKLIATAPDAYKLLEELCRENEHCFGDTRDRILKVLLEAGYTPKP